MTLKGWMALSTVVLTLTVTGLAFAQQPTAQPATPLMEHKERGTGTGMTNPASTDGKPTREAMSPRLPIAGHSRPTAAWTSLAQSAAFCGSFGFFQPD